MTAEQLLRATHLVSEFIIDGDYDLTQIVMDRYAPEPDGTVKWNVEIWGLTSDGNPNGLIIAEVV